VALALSFTFMSQVVYAASDGIVVWRIEAKTGVTDKDVDSISGFVTAEVERYSGRKVTSEADVATILKGEEIKQKCTGEGNSACIVEISNALGVPEAVSGDLGRMGDYWMLNLRRINVSSAEVIARVSRQINGDINALIEEIPASVAELFGVPVQNADNKPHDSRAYKIAGWTLVGSGAGLVVLGGVGQMMMSDANGSNKSSFDTWKAVSITGYAVGGAAIITGAVLLIYDATQGDSPKKADETEGTDAQSWNFGVAPTPDGLAANVMFRW